MKLKISRKEAIACGHSHYLGRVCLKHPKLLGERITSSRCCIRCADLKSYKARDKLREVIFKHYGIKCIACDEDDFDVLTIDHIRQDGALHRKKMGIREGTGMYRWLRNHGYPKGFRTLCQNCNTKAWKLHQLKLRKE